MVLVVFFITAFCLTALCIYYMFRMVTNVTGKYASLFAPFLLFTPNQFNAEGNLYRNKFIKCFPLLVLSYLCIFGAAFILENFDL